jgi:hypothetical protein
LRLSSFKENYNHNGDDAYLLWAMAYGETNSEALLPDDVEPRKKCFKMDPNTPPNQLYACPALPSSVLPFLHNNYLVFLPFTK